MSVTVEPVRLTKRAASVDSRRVRCPISALVRLFGVGCLVVLTCSRIDRGPEEYLRTTGSIFVVFDRQDSGNVSYGVEVDGTRYLRERLPDARTSTCHFLRTDSELRCFATPRGSATRTGILRYRDCIE